MKQASKYPINSDFEDLIMNGCKVIYKGSATFKSSEMEYTHILLECPKEFRKDEDNEGRGCVKFILIEWGNDFEVPCWYEAIEFFQTSNRSHATKRARAEVSEASQHYLLMKKRKEQEAAPLTTK
jgi:hypothetical protein